MNSVLNSLSSSPIANVMLKDSSMDSFIYNLESAFPSCTREKVELDIPNVGFSKKGQTKNMLVHRLVCISFIENEDNKPQVNLLHPFVFFPPVYCNPKEYQIDYKYSSQQLLGHIFIFSINSHSVNHSESGKCSKSSLLRFL